ARRVSERDAVTGTIGAAPATPAAAPAATGERRVVVLTTPEEVVAMSERWEALGPRHPDADPGFFLTCCRTGSTILRPHGIVLMRGDAPEALLAARLEEAPFLCGFGGRIVYRSKARYLTVVWAGALRADESVAWGPLVEAMTATLKDGTADIAYLTGIPMGS